RRRPRSQRDTRKRIIAGLGHPPNATRHFSLQPPGIPLSGGLFMIPPSSRNPAPAIVDTSAGVPHPRRFGQVGAASPANDQKAPLLSGGAFLTYHNLPQLVFPAPPRSSINVVDIGAMPASKSEYIDAAVTFALSELHLVPDGRAIHVARLGH